MENKSSKIKERVLQVADYYDVGREEFFKKLAVSYGNFKGKSKETPLNSTTVADILTMYPEVDALWLITGRGQMVRKQALTAQKTDGDSGVPLISLEAAAGFGNEAFQIAEKDIQARYVVPDFNHIDFMIRVKGSSMYPKYSSGDIIACRIILDSKFIQWGKVYVVATREQGLLCKRLRKPPEPDCYLVVSDNPEYEPFTIPKDEVTGIALVIGVIRLE